MGWFKLLIACVVLYLGQSYYLLSSSHVEKFLFDHNTLAMNDPVAACGNYSNDVMVMINHTTPEGTWEVEGGKDEMCGYMRQAQAALVVMQANTSGHFENMLVNTSFPWQNARTSYDEISNVRMGSMGSISSKTHDTLEIKRTLTGLEIVSVTSTGGPSNLTR
ncbi:hypothetical protein [Psychrobacter vallis]|uniref:hypothetical protein n=1 Tax=Psychrobacter vallis TaxID=248451 RepID=UPI0019182F6E|nr:hypothetical protein [Psychrobacter vallis]